MPGFVLCRSVRAAFLLFLESGDFFVCDIFKICDLDTHLPGFGGLLLGLETKKWTLPLFIKAVQFFFLAYIVYELGYALVTIVLYDVLDKHLYFKALSYSLEQMRLQMVQQHLPDTQIQDTLANATKDKDTGVTAGQVLLGFGQGLLLDFVKSVLLAIVLQKKPPVVAVEG